MLVPELLARGYGVDVLDNVMYQQTSLLSSCHHDAFEFHRGDARDRELLRTLMSRADIIVPLACLTGAPACDRDPWAAREIVIDALRLILDARRDDQRIVYPNTNSGYGIGAKGVPCTEESPLTPISLYGRLKVEAEAMIIEAGNAISFRLATVFGVAPRMRLDLLVNDFVYRADTDGFVVLYEADAKRNYIHIRDVARAFVHGLDRWEEMKDGVYNLGLSDANLSKRELCELIRGEIPGFYFVDAAIGEDPDKRDYIVSNEKIEATGFRPSRSLLDGVRELRKAYRMMNPVTPLYTNRI